MPLTKDEIRSLLSDIENERVERTISTDNVKKFSQAVCAFANDITNTRRPGYLIIGADDNGKLSNLKVTEKLMQILAGLRSEGNILPPPALSIYKVDMGEGEVAIAEVQPSMLTPVRYKGVIWIRVGARKEEANAEEERILMEKGRASICSFDASICPRATLSDLDIKKFKKIYLASAVSAKARRKDTRPIEQQMESLQLFDTRSNCPTMAGVLLLHHNPVRCLPGAYIQYVRFSGKDRASEVLKENAFSGNLIEILPELDAFIKYTIENKRPVLVTALREEMRVNYPYEAIRELVMNAVMHRSYEGSNAPIRFYEYSDRIEIDNSGNLYGKARPENFPTVSDYRNPVIAEIMKSLRYVNRFGRGVSTVNDMLVSNGNGEAIFEFSDHTTFKVTVMNSESVMTDDEFKELFDEHGKKGGNRTHMDGIGYDNRTQTSGAAQNNNVNHTQKSREVREEIILGIIRQNPRVSILKISELGNIPKNSVVRILAKLRDDGVIKREGSEKSGTWEIIE